MAAENHVVDDRLVQQIAYLDKAGHSRDHAKDRHVDAWCAAATKLTASGEESINEMSSGTLWEMGIEFLITLNY